MAIRIKIAAEYDSKGLRDAQKTLTDFGDKVKRTLAVAGAATVAAGVVFTKQAISVASDLEESINAVNVAYGSAADSILKIGETSAKAMGVSRGEFNAAAVRFSAFAERVVGSGGDVAGFIQDISLRAADFASVFNIDVAEALRVFQSGLSGEAEPLKRFGINLLDSEVKAYALRTELIKQGETMTETQKVQARYGLLMESTNKTAGDFANTSDSLANSQRILKATFTDLQGQIGTALLPVMGELLTAVADGLLPAMEEFSAWINSPDGKTAVAELGEVLVDVVKGIVDFGVFLADNWQTIVNFAIAIGTFTIAVQAATTAIGLYNAVSVIMAASTTGATLATTNLSIALKALPWVALAVGVASFVQSLADYADEVYGSKVATDGLTDAQIKQAQKVEGLENLIDQYRYALENSTLANRDLARNGIAVAAAELSRMGVQSTVVEGHLKDLNNIKLTTLKAQITETAGEMNRFRNIAEGFIAPIAEPNLDPNAGGGGGGGESAAEKAARERREAFEKVQDLIKRSQKDLAAAQKQYNATVSKLHSDNTKAIAQIQADFGARLADIAIQSQKRLTAAFSQAATFTLSDLFQVEETKSADNLIQGLTDRLKGSKDLIANAGKLNAAGFSQTFIEQVVAAGVTTGNELAQAILDSTPQTQAELQKLFAEMEVTTNTGMDTLAAKIYEKQGLATQELKDLYVTTQMELGEALLDQQASLRDGLTAANDAFQESVMNIRTALSEDLAEMDGMFGGLGGTIDRFMDKLDELITKYEDVSDAAKMAGLSSSGSVSIPRASLPTPAASITPKPSSTTNIVINAKVDQTQSAAQVGKVIAQSVNKYTGLGGGLRIGSAAV